MLFLDEDCRQAQYKIVDSLKRYRKLKRKGVRIKRGSKRGRPDCICFQGAGVYGSHEPHMIETIYALVRMLISGLSPQPGLRGVNF